jgi:hypothetical protein
MKILLLFICLFISSHKLFAQVVQVDSSKFEDYIIREMFYFDNKRKGILSQKPILGARRFSLVIDSISIDTTKNKCFFSGKIYDNISSGDSTPMLMPVKIIYGSIYDKFKVKAEFRKYIILKSLNNKIINPSGVCHFEIKFTYLKGQKLYFVSPAYLITTYDIDELLKALKI